MKPVLAGRQFASVTTLAGLVAGLLVSSGTLRATDLSLPITGELLGTVVDGTGVPQMGASVRVLNKYRRFIGRTMTNTDGRFAFAGLAPDLYSVQVSLASFLPASHDRIEVKPGLDSVLQIHLATLLSNIQVSYRVPTAMSEDWKWVLRSSPATRPINRLLPDDFPAAQESKVRPRVFSDTHAMLSVSGGDGGLIDADDSGIDLGTSFALSTNVLGKNQLQVAGVIGQNAEFGPATVALCAIYSRNDTGMFAAPPEITLTMAQIGGLSSQLTNNAPNASAINGGGVPALRSMSLSMYEVADPIDNVHLEYGLTGETVEYLQHASRISPFARITVDLGRAGSIIAAYSDGGRPDELSAHQQPPASGIDAGNDDLSAPLQSLSRLPQVSNQNGRLQLQRTQNYEVGYKKVTGSRTYAVSGFSERVSNGRVNVTGDLAPLDSGDLFFDGISPVSTYNIGNYDRSGFLASVDQRVNDMMEVGAGYGRLGGFTAGNGSVNASSLSSPAAFLSESQHNLATVNLKTTAPHVGTRIIFNYGWIDPRAIIPRHIFTTQDMIATPGFNILLRQPLPSFFGIPGHLELTADLRNLLADGYTPINAGNGQQLLAVETPRAIRGGLKFTF
ncbi:MAG TPA: TonB-dependent receptor [Bryobacteraceae bacterium]|nr:TonB-dependent receptor [Bryobacteraceae bacterium]